MAFDDIANLLRGSIGLNAASIGQNAIAHAVDQRAAVCQLDDPAAYWRHLRQSRAELQELIEAVVVPETWFFRDPGAFEALVPLLAEERFDSASPPQITTLLSLPCSTGEEPYSMAMALLDASVPPDRFRIDAVDISRRALTAADRAVYRRNSFRGPAMTFRDRYFTPTAEGYQLHDRVRRQVHFACGNLYAPNFMPGADLYDVVFCRNILIYSDRPTQDRALRVLTRLLKPNGTLFVAPAETSLPPTHDFVSMRLPRAFAFRRTASAHRPPPLAVPVTLAVPRVQAVPVAAATRQQTVSARTNPRAPDQGDLEDAARLADQGHFVEAAIRCETYLRRHGPSAAAFYLMGLVRDATGNTVEAIAQYRKALYLQPTHAEALIHLALLIEAQGDVAGARILRNRARRLETQTETSA